MFRFVSTISIAIVWCLAGSFPVSAQTITDHRQNCRKWEDLGERLFADFRTKYQIPGAGDQLRNEVMAAQGAAWSDDAVRHLQFVIHEEQSNRWQSLDEFGAHVYGDCVAVWKATTTQQQRDAEAGTIRLRNEQLGDLVKEQKRQHFHILACAEYEKVATGVLIKKSLGASYKDASDWALSQTIDVGDEFRELPEDDIDVLLALTAAVYFARDKYGKDNNTFALAAFQHCLRNDFLSAAPTK